MNQEPISSPMKIVVGIELDETGDLALQRAMDLARATGARLHLCYGGGDVTGDPAQDERLLSAAEKRLSSWAYSRFVGNPLIGVTELHASIGKASDVLTQLAVDTEAHLIVVGTHHKSMVERFAKGSVVHDLLHGAPCSVMVAMPFDYQEREKSPELQPAPPPQAEPRHLGRPHTYHHRRSIRMAVAQPTIATTQQPLQPS